jgi:transposase
MDSVVYVGMDVDMEKIATAVMGSSGSEILDERVIRNGASAIRKYFGELGKRGELMACYEAGCCGFELHRLLTELGVCCLVAAPGLVPRRASDRVKTDRRDARILVRALRNGDLSGVYVPTRADEATRDYLRMNEDLKRELRRAKQRVLSFLLRKGLRWEGKTNWTEKHRLWLRSVQLENPLEQETLSEYLCHIADLEERCARVSERVEQIAQQDRYAEQVATLKAFKGVETLIALSFVVEIADFRRFATADQFMAFLGLVPCERSSGGKRRLGGITKAGNSHLRKLLIEAGWQYRSYHPTSRRLMRRRAGLPAELVNYANRAGRRLSRKYQRLLFAGKPSQVAATAVARELAGFLWGAMVGQVA